MYRYLYSFFLFLISHLAYSQQEIKSGYFTSFDSTRIYYETIGEGKPVVLVHGFIVDGESWKNTPLYTDLLREGFKIITLDLRGNGKSDKPHSAERYSDDAEAKDIIQLMRNLHIPRYDVVGYSRGAIITSRLLVLDDKVNKGVLGGMGADFTDPDWERREKFYKALSGEDVAELQGMVQTVKDKNLDQQALAFSQKEQPTTTSRELRRVRIPVLVISGNEDEDNGSPEALGKMIAHAVVQRVEGNHDNTLQSTDFSAAVISFLKK